MASDTSAIRIEFTTFIGARSFIMVVLLTQFSLNALDFLFHDLSGHPVALIREIQVSQHVVEVFFQSKMVVVILFKDFVLHRLREPILDRFVNGFL